MTLKQLGLNEVKNLAEKKYQTFQELRTVPSA